eukprot:symbB.v1.2.006011.t1/scaffold356.1/size220710/8
MREAGRLLSPAPVESLSQADEVEETAEFVSLLEPVDSPFRNVAEAASKVPPQDSADPSSPFKEKDDAMGESVMQTQAPRAADARVDPTADTAAAVAAAKAATPAPRPARPDGDTSSLDGVWCSTHFQYRWRCKQDGHLAHECEAEASSAGPAGKSGKSKGGRKGRGKGQPVEGEETLGDEELEELEFQRLAAELDDEHQDLRAQARRAKRGADMVTPEMQADVESLLEALGIPFVHAPAEAEAQCAFLAEARLVDAVASDDSDVLVFGAREVYRRMFSEDQQVECYSTARLEARLGLLQDHLIVLAMLLGCDYTLGVHGVGIVNGLEIVRAYSPGRGHGTVQEWLQQLGTFRSWAQNVANWGQESAGVQDEDDRAMAEHHKLWKLQGGTLGQTNAMGEDSFWNIEYLFDYAVAQAVEWICPSRPAEEENALVKVFREGTRMENGCLIAAALVMGDVYLGFCLTEQPLLSIPSVIFYGSAGLAFVSWESAVTTDPGGIPDSFARDDGGRPRFESDINETALVQSNQCLSRRSLVFCPKEQKFKPKRSHYCKQMKKYVLRMDHYCFWMSNGIGYKNYKYFYLFLLYSAMATSVEAAAAMLQFGQSHVLAQVLLLPGQE